MSGFEVAVVGATGAVGREMIRTLDARAFPVSRLRLMASARSAGQKVEFQGLGFAVEFVALRFIKFGAGSGRGDACFGCLNLPIQGVYPLLNVVVFPGFRSLLPG